NWLRWDCDFPTNDNVPGQGGACLTPWNFIVRLLQWMHQKYQASAARVLVKTGDADGLPDPETHLHAARARAEGLDLHGLHLHLPFDHTAVVNHVQEFLDQFRDVIDGKMAGNNRLRRDFILLSLAGTLVRGIIADGVLHTGFDPLDRYDFREWLKKHGAPEIAYQSAPVQALYDLVFAYEGGDLAKPNFAAGGAPRAPLRTAWSYQGGYACQKTGGQ